MPRVPRFAAKVRLRDIHERLDKTGNDGWDKAREVEDSFRARLEKVLADLGAKVLPDNLPEDRITAQELIQRSKEHRQALDAVIRDMLVEASALGMHQGWTQLIQAARAVKATATATLNWELSNRDVHDWLYGSGSYSRHLIDSVGATEEARIRELVQQWTENQQPRSWLREQIRGENGLYSPRRADLISRTEVTRAYANGNAATWRNERVKQVRWNTKSDELVCDICGGNDGQLFDVDSNDLPPAHPGCRCWISPIVDIPGLSEWNRETNQVVPSVDDIKEALDSGEIPQAPVKPDLGQMVRPTAESDAAAYNLSGQMVQASDQEARFGEIVARNVGDPELHPGDIERILLEWQGTSNDHDLQALSFQEYASEYFGVDLSDWQKNKLAQVLKERADAEAAGEILGPYQRRSIELLPRQAGEAARTISEAELRDLNLKAIDGIYKQAQKEMADQGIEYVTVYRGAVLPRSVVEGMQVGDLVPYAGNTLESWTVEERVATRFARRASAAFDEVAVMVSAQVPRERILGTALQGVGTLYESEVVVIGGSNDSVMLSFIRR